MDPKFWLQSRTVIVNVLTLVLLVLNNAGFVSILPPEAAQYVAMAITVINVLLRFLTTQPVSLTRQQ